MDFVEPKLVRQHILSNFCRTKSSIWFDKTAEGCKMMIPQFGWFDKIFCRTFVEPKVSVHGQDRRAANNKCSTNWLGRQNIFSLHAILFQALFLQIGHCISIDSLVRIVCICSMLAFIRAFISESFLCGLQLCYFTRTAHTVQKILFALSSCLWVAIPTR